MKRVDVLLITAAEGEDEGVLAVEDERLSQWKKEERFGYPVWFADFRTPTGGVLRVALARPVDMGGEHTATTASLLVNELKPQCLAMCGVCGGRPGWTNLGDVIIASKTWRYDTGELVRRTSGAEPEINQSVTTYQLAAPWLPKAQAIAKAWSNPADGQWPSAATWLTKRPLDYDLQGLWLLRELAEGRDPLLAPERERAQHCPNWKAVVIQLEERGWLLGGDITDAGRKHARAALFRSGGELPEQGGWQIHVGALATGNRLVRDVDIWSTLEKTERLTYGLDMEASALSMTGWVHGVEHALVVKGVMDYAEPERHRGFRAFAARAAAEVLLRFLRETLPPRGGGLRDLLPSGATPVESHTNPAGLLNACHEVVPFFDPSRQRELELLESWCHDPSPAPSVRVWVGPGGAGKTRLFIEWGQRLRQQGWAAGFLPRDANEYFAKLDARAAPALLVIDYAETRFEQLEALLTHLGTQRTAAPLRVALLARQAGDWLQSLQQQSIEIRRLLGAADPIMLTPLSFEAELRPRVFRHAVQAFAEQLGKGHDVPVPDLTDRRFQRPLYVHMAALAAVEGRSLAPDRLLEDTVDHERHFWKRAQGTHDDARIFQRSAARLVAALTLRGRTERGEALAALDERVKGPRAERFHDLVADLYQAPSEPGKDQVGGLEPDLLGEEVIRGVLADSTTERAFLEQVAQGAGEPELTTMLNVLGRVDLRTPSVTEVRLREFLAKNLPTRALPAWSAALALAKDTAGARLGKLLANALEVGPAPAGLAQTIEHQFPEHTVSLRELAVWALHVQLSALPENEGSRAERARLQNKLGLRLRELGRREEALEATREAVELGRALAEVHPGAFLPNLAGSLTNLGMMLSELGRREEALEATREAVELCRALAEARPNVFLPKLVRSLNNLGAQLSELGRREEALEATREAVELRRALTKAHPNAFLPDLSLSLNNLGAQLGRLGRREEALGATREAVKLRRALTKAHPDGFLPDLAMSLRACSPAIRREIRA